MKALLASCPRPARLGALALALCATLTACGGGTASSGNPAPAPGPAPVPPPPPPPAGFSFSLDTGKAIVWQGKQASVAVTVQRDAGFTDAIQFSADGLPSGATAAALSIPAGSSTGTLTLQAGAAAPHSLPTGVTIKGVATAASATQALTVTVRGEAGDIDTSFGGGVLVTPGGITDDYVRGLAVQADGKVVVVGHGVFSVATGTDFMLVRHLRDGGLDNSFGNGGKVTTAFNNGGRSDEALAVAVQPDGKILVAGTSDQGASGYDFALARYNADGTLDAGFGTAGIVRDVFGSITGAARGVVVTADNKLVLAGHRDHDFAAVRLSPNGALDAGFAATGRGVFAVSASNWDEATSLVQQADGRLLLGGWVYTGNSSSADTVLLRLNADGSTDTGFGPGGLRITPVAAGNKSDAGRALALQPDERVPTVRVLQAGEASGSDLDGVLMRHWL